MPRFRSTESTLLDPQAPSTRSLPESPGPSRFLRFRHRFSQPVFSLTVGRWGETPHLAFDLPTAGGGMSVLHE